jgi:CTP-dependent riboflavin kinase
MLDVNKRFNNAVNDVVAEVQVHNWKNAIEAAIEIAGMIKASGLGKQSYFAVMENIEIQIKATLGLEPLLAYQRAMKNKEHYLSNSVIIIPN